jgi:phenylpropionate dioxygenase-like ring-hydroxylating dioxygenase large terminal subunit
MPTSKLTSRYEIFNRTDVVAEGWYWLMPSATLRKGMVRPANIFGNELAVYRAADGTVAALDAYCPHMGAHLAEGKVEGNQLRCFFHNWCFDKSGACVDIPCLNGSIPAVSARAWNVAEKHGLIWIWLAAGKPTEEVPEPPELKGTEYVASLGNRFLKNCHPNVVMVNAIDEQHFQTVHRMPGHILSMTPEAKTQTYIAFRNTGRVPTQSFFGRMIAPLYKNALTYDLDYWYGSTGTVTLGPDFLHLYLMFALRLSDDGKTEGFAVAFTRARKGIFGLAFNWLVLEVTKLAGLYFALGDTRVFQTIRFDFKTPIHADRAVIAFIHHLERQSRFKPV